VVKTGVQILIKTSIFFFFSLKLRTNIMINTRQFLNKGIYNIRTCKISHGKGNRTLKPKRQSPKPYPEKLLRGIWVFLAAKIF